MDIKNKTSKQLLWAGIMGIVMFFAGLTSAYIVRKAEGNWFLFELPSSFLYSTIIILFSSLLLIVGIRRIKSGEQSLIFIASAFVLGIVFAFFQWKGWEELIRQGIYFTGETSNPSGSFFYVLTLTHLAHLIGGLIALAVVTIKTTKSIYTSTNYLGVELASIYWHFLAILWVYLYLFLRYM
ncbi:MAG: cytochrome c oxidase subunit 3 [Bacteroidota bacterium]|nr:cytochrome c oxidase subunit 3 [Bacteroidota bacterium]